MGKDISHGVVDRFGRVFKKDINDPSKVYDGLYVADASIIPTALGVNPSLTISALSLRIADFIVSGLHPVRNGKVDSHSEGRGLRP